MDSCFLQQLHGLQAHACMRSHWVSTVADTWACSAQGLLTLPADEFLHATLTAFPAVVLTSCTAPPFQQSSDPVSWSSADTLLCMEATPAQSLRSAAQAARHDACPCSRVWQPLRGQRRTPCMLGAGLCGC